MRILFIIITSCFFCSYTFGQIKTPFRIGFVNMGNNAQLSVTTNSFNVDASNSCFQITNSLPMFFKLGTGAFDDHCVVTAVPVVATPSVLQFSISPNPTQGILFIKVSGRMTSPDKTCRINVLDLSGRSVFSTDIKIYQLFAGVTIDISSLSSAIYIISVESASIKAQFKIIKTRA